MKVPGDTLKFIIYSRSAAERDSTGMLLLPPTVRGKSVREFMSTLGLRQ